MEKRYFWIIGLIVVFVIVGIFLINNYTGFNVKTVSLCEDSDAIEETGVYPRGNNFYLEGKISRASIARYDACSEDNKRLREYYCRNKEAIWSNLVECPNGCSNGACIE